MKKIVNYLCEPRLRVSSISWVNGNKKILDNVSFSLYPGEVLCLLGDSGCGKTSLLRVISGLDKQDMGEIYINEERISTARLNMPPELRPVSLIFQDYALFPHMTVYENIAYGLKDFDRYQKKLKIDKVLTDLGLIQYSEKYPHELSGGEQQRVALARATAPEPVILLMDEPFSGLDRSLREHIREETISVLRNSESAVILVTHDPEEAMLMGDRIALMKDGKIIQIGSNDELIFSPANDYTVSTFSNVNTYITRVKSKKVKTPFGEFDAVNVDEGYEVKVLIRDQAFNLTAPSKENSYIVKQIDFTGENTRIQLTPIDSFDVVKITVPGLSSVKIDDSIGLTVDERFVHIF